MRGKRQSTREDTVLWGLIPAYAGKTSTASHRRCESTAHPRVCGENRNAAPALIHGGGSSPRMRGKRRSYGNGPSIGRLIPAYAGKTGSLFPGPCAKRAHPRVCGENFIFFPNSKSRGGSSPRMRGKPCLRRPGRRTHRLIPAYAGKTLNDLEF